MKIYNVSCDLKSLNHDYGPLYSLLDSIGAHQATATNWLIETSLPISEVSEQLLNMMGRSDGLFVVEITVAAAWAATRLAGATGPWLKKVRP